MKSKSTSPHNFRRRVNRKYNRHIHRKRVVKELIDLDASKEILKIVDPTFYRFFVYGMSPCSRKCLFLWARFSSQRPIRWPIMTVFPWGQIHGLPI